MNRQSDKKWPKADSEGLQQLEIKCGSKHVSLTTMQFGSMSDLKKCEDSAGLFVCYYFINDLRTLVTTLLNMHFKASPI